MGFSVRGSYFGALIFPLSGFFIGHAQHMGWIIAGTWIPHVLASFIYFGKDFNWSYGVSFVVSFFLLCSGGYPGLSIVTTYIVVIIAAWQLFKKSPLSIERKRQLKQYVRLALLTICTCALVIACFISLKSALWRGQGLDGQDSLVGSFYLRHLISLIFPFSTVKGSFEVWQADQSVMNIYLGLPVLFIVSIGLRSIKKYRKFLTFALVSLLLSLGAELPFRSWANVLPMWDLFRFPTLFRYFFILAVVLLAIQILDDHQHSLQKFRAQLAQLTMITAALGLLLFAYWIIVHPSAVKLALKLSVPSILPALVLQTLSICMLAGLATMFLRRRSLGFWPVLFFIAAIDMGIMVQTNGRVSVFSERRLAPMQACLEELPKGYPAPSLLDPIGSNEDRTLNFGSIYRNTSMLFKQPSWDGYSPFQYNGYVAFNNGPHYENALKQPFVFLSKLDPIADEKTYYNSSSLLYTKENILKLVGFQPNRMRVEVNLAYPRLLVVNQNFVDNWKAQIEDRDLPVVKTDQNLLSIILPAGKNKVDISYQNSLLSNALGISAILFSCLLFILMIIYLPMAGWLGLLISFLLFFMSSDLLNRNTVEIKESRKSMEVAKTIRNNIDACQAQDSNVIEDRFLDWRDFPRFRELIRNQSHPFQYESRSLCDREDFFVNFLHSTRHLDSIKVVDENLMICYPANYLSSFVASFNGFEGYANGWKKVDQGNILDRNGNRFQKLEGQKFSSIWDTSLSLESKHSFNLDISVDTRGEDLEDVGLVYALQEGDEILIYRSQILQQEQDTLKWRKTKWISSIGVEPGDYNLRVYLWNPTLKNLDLDNFSIVVERQ